MLLDRYDHLGFHGWAAGAGDGEHVGEPGDHQTEIGGRPAGPFVRQGGAVADTDVDFFQRAGHRVEAGGEHDRVEFVFIHRRPQAGFRQFHYWIGSRVYQRDVVAVVRFVIIGIEAKALGADRMVLRRQPFRDRLVFDDAPDLVAHEFRCGVVGRLVHQDVGVGVEKTDAAAFGPFGFVLGLAFRRCRFQRGLGRGWKTGDAERGIVGRQTPFRVFRLVASLDVRVHWAVARGQAEVSGALEDVQMLRLLGDDRDHLDAGRSGADHADPKAGEIHALMRPETGVVPFALEPLDAFEIRHARGR